MNSNMETDANDHLKTLERRLQSLERRVEEIESSFNPTVEDKVALYLTVPDSLRKSFLRFQLLQKLRLMKCVSERAATDRSKINISTNLCGQAG